MGLLKRVTLLASGEGTARILGIATSVVLARALSVAGFGDFSSAMSLAMVLMVVIDLGQNVHLVKVAATGTQRSDHTLSHVLFNKILATVLLAATVFLLSRFSDEWSRWGMVAGVMIIWAGALSILESLRVVARSNGLFASDSIVNGLESLLRLVGVLVAAAVGLGIVGFSWVFVGEIVVATLLYGVWVARRLGVRWSRLSLTHSWNVMTASVPAGLTALGLAGFYRMDQVMVLALAGSLDAGAYAAAAKISLSANAVGVLVVMAVFPDLTRASVNLVHFAKKTREALVMSATLGALAFLAVLVFSEAAVQTLYGSEFEPAVPLLKVLSVVVLFNSVTVVAMAATYALGRERRAIRVVLALSAANILLNAVLVPLYGAMAAAVISVLGEAVMAALLLWLLRDLLTRVPVRRR